MKKEKCHCEECHCEEENVNECCCEENQCENEKQHLDKLNEAYNKISELEDALLRSKAEFINYRKRLEEETSKSLKFANEGIVKEILPIIDNFERAIKMDDENLDDELSKLLAGFKMVYCNLVSILNKYEVKEIEVLNKPYDANNAQAVIQEHTEGVESGIVVEVLQKGYELKGKVIRPAMVKVSE
jgi:molecular chaperone GrpE